MVFAFESEVRHYTTYRNHYIIVFLKVDVTEVTAHFPTSRESSLNTVVVSSPKTSELLF